MSRVILTFLFIVLIAPGAFAEGKITTDPNAPGAKLPVAVEEESGDKRLAQKVTYEAKKKMVVEILGDLAKMTGITFKAGANNVDWQVRDRRMNVFAKDVPLAQLTDSIARALHLTWSKSDKEDPPEYRLRESERTLLDAEAKLAQQEQERRKRLAEKRKRALETFEKAAAMSPAELEQLKQDNALLYFCTSSGMTGPICAFLKEVPGARDAVLNGQPLTVNGADLSHAGRQAVLGMLASGEEFEKRFDGSVSQSFEGDVGQMNIVVNDDLLRGLRSDSPEATLLLGGISLECDGDENGDGSFHGGVPIIDPESAVGKLLGKQMLRNEQEGCDLGDLVTQQATELATAIAEDERGYTSGEGQPERPPDPDLEKKVKLDRWGSELEDVLGIAFEASSFAIVSDSFGHPPRWSGVRAMVAGEIELNRVFDNIGLAYRCEWERHGPVIEFSHRDWFRLRAAMVSEAWLEDWRSKITKNKMDIDDLVRMAGLTREQVEMNLDNDEVLAVFHSQAVDGYEDILKFYGSLSPAQRAAVFSVPGLTLRELDSALWSAAEKLVRDNEPAVLEDSDTPVALQGVRLPGPPLEYVFVVPSENAEAYWEIAVPEYEPPSEEEGE